MNLETVLNIYMLFTAGIGLFLCLYRYVETPNRIWTYATLFFLGHFLSDYYWTIYLLIMNADPTTSALLAYFGWNATYVFLFLMQRRLQTKEEKDYFSAVMLIPIPLNIAQFCLYLPYGGIINNIWQGLFCTMIACTSIQSLLYYLKNKKKGTAFPWLQFLSLLFVIGEYGMWTSSCFTFENQYLDPYYYFSFIGFTVTLMLPWGIWKDSLSENTDKEKRSVIGPRFRMVFQVLIALIICGCSMGGYFVAGKMRDWLDTQPQTPLDQNIYNRIAVTLFGISVILVLVIIALMLAIHTHLKNAKQKVMIESEIKGKFNFLFTLSITFILMVFAVIYTSQLLYQESVSGLYGDCEEEVAGIATDLSNYLSRAEAILWVTGDSVDQMRKNGIDKEKIHEYIRVETTNQAERFDENFMGLYGVIEGDFLDGLDWVPPTGYEPTERDWYVRALDAGGDVTIIPPYVDAHTGTVIISVSKMLSDEKSVLSVDVSLDHIQETVSNISINGDGYGMIIDRNGMVVSHFDKKKNGLYCRDLFKNDDFLNTVLSVRNGCTKVMLDGSEYTVFINEVHDQWYTMALVKSDELLSNVHQKLIVNMCVYIIIFFLITFFYYTSYMNEQKASKLMEELITERQKQEYESKVLKLEKSSADDANRAKSRFLADMSHEIRTPINAVLGMNEMILRETDNESIREYADNIRSSGKALLSLINSILDFSKIEDGKMEIVCVDYKTADMIRYLQSSIAERALAKKLSFVVDIDPTIPVMLRGDDMRVSQVIMNLLTNAVKYTNAGEVKLSMKNMGCSSEVIRLMVSIADTGIGIRKEDMPKLFESFERLDKEKNRNIEGTGLGMSIVTSLLSMMGSELSVESEYGIGSTFSFIIDQGIVDKTEIGDSFVQMSEGEKNVTNDNSYHESFHAPDCRILIVDDTKMNLRVVSNLLKKTQIGIDTALSGEEALTLCSQKKYDVILMDQRMPGMDGTLALARIRARRDDPNADTPVICLTADAISGARDRYLAEGFSDYLTKPVDSRELENMLLTHLPKEKVTQHDGTQQENAAAPWNSAKYENLQRNGIDLRKAFTYCRNDVEIFENMITEYAMDARDKEQKLREFFDKMDWENYSIFVHALKSTSKLIGAAQLSEMAAKLETASRDGDFVMVNAMHDDMLRTYRTLVTCIRETMSIPAEADDTISMSDDLVLEFMPDEGNDK